MDNKQQAIENINKARLLLREAFVLIQEENKNDNQFDYVTSSSLSNGFDEVAVLVDKMDGIIYQR